MFSVASVNIDSSKTVANNLVYYNLNCHYVDNYQLGDFLEESVWQISRNSKEIFSVIHQLPDCPKLVSNLLNKMVPDTESEILLVFNKILSVYSDQVWYTSILFKFFDDKNEQSVLTKIQIHRMSAQIAQLKKRCDEYELKLAVTEDKAVQLMRVLDLPERISSSDSNLQMFDSSYYDPAAAPLTAENLSCFNDALPTSKSLSRPQSEVGQLSRDTSANQTSFTSNMTSSERASQPDRNSNLHSLIPELLDEYEESDDDESVTSVRKAHNNTGLVKGLRTISSDLLLDEDHKWKSSENLHELRYRWESKGKSRQNSSILLSSELFPTGVLSDMMDYFVDEILQTLQPHVEQLQYRDSAINFLRKFTRKSISSNVFEIGLHQLRAFLPDDAIKLSVTISKSHLSDWHKIFIEHTNNVIEKIAPILEDEDNDHFEDTKPLLVHSVSGVSCCSYNSNFKVMGMIDSIEFEIVSNSRADLCMLAFLEEVNTIVGKDFLFKRSIILIRAWLNYDAEQYAGSPIKHYLSDFAVCIMICAIFNQFYNTINTPFDALCYFLLEYSNYDGTSQAITIQGIVPFKSETSNQPLLPIADFNFLLPTSLIDKYWQAFNISQIDEEDTEYQLRMASSSSEDIGSVVNFSVGNNSNNGSTLKNFDRFLFNVIHPFTHTNMVREKLSTRRVAKLTKALQCGATGLSVLLKEVSSIQSNSKLCQEKLKNFFALTLQKFSSKSRPDTVGDIIFIAADPRTSGIRNLLNTSMDVVMKNIQYFDLVLESIISEHALLTISHEILADKGPLPVGEVGKVLTELSSNPNLSLKLKESFGGLKKFLEKYPEKFIIVNDHPFNPHVLLRQTLTPQQLEIVNRGVVPPQLLGKNKKNSTLKKKSSKQTMTANQPIVDRNGLISSSNMLPISTPLITGNPLNGNMNSSGNNSPPFPNNSMPTIQSSLVGRTNNEQLLGNKTMNGSNSSPQSALRMQQFNNQQPQMMPLMHSMDQAVPPRGHSFHGSTPLERDRSDRLLMTQHQRNNMMNPYHNDVMGINNTTTNPGNIPNNIISKHNKGNNNSYNRSDTDLLLSASSTDSSQMKMMSLLRSSSMEMNDYSSTNQSQSMKSFPVQYPSNNNNNSANVFVNSNQNNSNLSRHSSFNLKHPVTSMHQTSLTSYANELTDFNNNSNNNNNNQQNRQKSQIQSTQLQYQQLHVQQQQQQFLQQQQQQQQLLQQQQQQQQLQQQHQQQQLLQQQQQQQLQQQQQQQQLYYTNNGTNLQRQSNKSYDYGKPSTVLNEQKNSYNSFENEQYSFPTSYPPSKIAFPASIQSNLSTDESGISNLNSLYTSLFSSEQYSGIDNNNSSLFK
eukprot:gene5817-8023_t